MKAINFVFWVLLSAVCFGSESNELPPEKIKSLIAVVTEASNRMMLNGSKVEDIDALFSLYTDDLIYRHDVYGGLYTREHLYRNSVNNLIAGRYRQTQGRYQVLNVMTGLNAAAVERLEVASGQVNLSVFEFKGEKIAKITEYWK